MLGRIPIIAGSLFLKINSLINREAPNGSLPRRAVCVMAFDSSDTRPAKAGSEGESQRMEVPWRAGASGSALAR